MLTLMDFYADWCGPCKMMAPIFAEVEKDYEGKVEFKKIDVETNPTEAGKYGVMGTPTLIFFCDGRSVGEAVGFRPKESFNEVLQDMLEKHKVCVSQSTKLDV